MDDTTQAAADAAALFQVDELSPLAPEGASGGFDWASMAREAGGVLKDLYGSYTAASSQQKIIDLNAERARRGLPPLSVEAVSPQVNVGVSPQTRQLITYAVIGAGAFYVLPHFLEAMRRRR